MLQVLGSPSHFPAKKFSGAGPAAENQDFGSVIEESNFPGKAQLGLFALRLSVEQHQERFYLKNLLKNLK